MIYTEWSILSARCPDQHVNSGFAAKTAPPLANTSPSVRPHRFPVHLYFNTFFHTFFLATPQSHSYLSHGKEKFLHFKRGPLSDTQRAWPSSKCHSLAHLLGIWVRHVPCRKLRVARTHLPLTTVFTESPHLPLSGIWQWANVCSNDVISCAEYRVLPSILPFFD